MPLCPFFHLPGRKKTSHYRLRDWGVGVGVCVGGGVLFPGILIWEGFSMESFLHLANPLKRGHCRVNLLLFPQHSTVRDTGEAVGGSTGGQGSDTVREKRLVYLF